MNLMTYRYKVHLILWLCFVFPVIHVLLLITCIGEMMGHYMDVLVILITFMSCTGACFCVSCLILKVLVVTIDAQWEGMGDVGSAR